MDLYARIALVQGLQKNETGVITYEQHIGLNELLEDLLNEARTKANKAAGTANIARAFKAVIKNTKTCSPSFQGGVKIGEYLYVCDGHRIMRTKSQVQIPMAPAGTVPTRFDEFFDNTAGNMQHREVVDLPDYADLVTETKTARKKYGKGGYVFYTFENGLTVNAEYLVDAMMATGAKTLVRGQDETKKPVMICSDTVETILLPCHVSGDRSGEKVGVWGRY